MLVYKGRLALAIACSFLMAGCSALSGVFAGWFSAIKSGEPVTNIKVVRLGIEYGWFAPDQANAALLWIVAIFTICVYVPKGIFTYVNNYTVASVTNRIGADVRMHMYAHLQTLPLSFFHKSRIGDIISRMNNDVVLIQNSSQVVTQVIDAPSMILVGLGFMFFISWKLALVTIVFVPLMGLAIDRLAKKMRALTMATQMKLADVSATIDESVRGIRIIRSFGTEEQEVKRFARVNDNSLRAALRAARRACVVLPTVELMGAVAAALVMLIGGLMMVRGDIKFATLIMFTVVAFNVAGAAKQLGRLNVIYQQTIAGADRVFEIIDTKSDLHEDPNGVVLADVQGRVEFREVTFEYNPGEIVLDKLSFKIDPGEAVAIVGTSGAGKSTIADLIPRFYDVTSGAVLVEGHDVRHIKTESLREHIAIVPQETILFSGTIADNISYGRPGADVTDVIGAAEAANAHEFISQLPAGYDTVLGEGGVGLSGGQRQRIAIARALLKDPKILILDEATSSLDAMSEGIVQEALERLMRGRSTLVIAHRLSTVTGANRILVLDKGRMVECGSFDELVSRGGPFAHLYRMQLRSEEME